MNRTIFVSVTVFLLLFSFVSCGFSFFQTEPIYRFEATYSEKHTAAYFMNQYVHTDPNLVHVYAAINQADEYEYSGEVCKYYAIKDVSIEEYVCYSSDFRILDPGFSAYIVRNKDFEIPTAEILAFEVSGAELFWADGTCYQDSRYKNKMEALGKNIFYENVAEIDAAAFQKSLKENLEAQNYVKKDDTDCTYIRKKFQATEKMYSQLTLKVRVHFKDYANIVWDAAVVKLPGVQDTCYVEYYQFKVTEEQPEGYYERIFIPLDDVIGKLVPVVPNDDYM